MKKMLLSLVALVVIAGCTKETIVQGGNANIQSIIYDADSTSWSSNGGVVWITDLAAAEITDNVLNNGAVLVYQVYTDKGATVNEQVPSSYPSSNLLISATVKTGHVFIYYENTAGTAVPNPGKYEFRIVIMDALGKTGYEPKANEVLVKTTVKR